MELKESLKKLPEQPGIYFMKNSLGTIIYVGKAKNLKARVSQYFQKNRNNSPKIDEMIEHIDSFEVVTTDTELEAFLLECKTIKELKPKYNRQLKNFKGYKYIKISIQEDYPKVTMTAQQKKDRALYFGPFTSEGSVENTIQFIKDFYPIRKCSSGALNSSSSGCLNFHLGKCLGPCRGMDIKESYGNQISIIIQFLQGKDYAPIKDLHAKMKAAANNLEFEKAAQFRDQIRGIRHVLNKQRIIKVSRYGRNILAAEKYGENGVKLFLIKGNKLLQVESIPTLEKDDAVLEEKLRNLVAGCLKPFKKEKEGGLSQEDVDEAQIIHSYLKNKNNGIRSVHIPASRMDTINYRRLIELLLQK
ncbi:MAG: GIY-YIG nuclease family protein [Clostridia bacterium]|nr:GIY-YIG nuclease family protein [Clostridia bacterium]